MRCVKGSVIDRAVQTAMKPPARSAKKVPPVVIQVLKVLIRLADSVVSFKNLLISELL